MIEELEDLRLRLAPAITIVRDDASTCYLMVSGRELFRCRGPLVPVLVDSLLPLLDGKHTVGELPALLAGKMEPAQVNDLVRLLMEHRVVVDVRPEQALSSRERERFASLLMLLARSSAEPYRVLARLRQMRVAVLGDSELACEVACSLAECAIGTIDLLTEGVPPPLEAARCVELRSASLDTMEDVVPRAALVIGVQDGEFNFTRRLRELNRHCLKLGTPCFQVRLTMEAEAWIGPIHTPGTACIECMDMRLGSQLQTSREYLLHRQQVEQGVVRGKRLGFKPLMRQLADAVAIEVLLHLAELEPARLMGRSMLVDLLTRESSLHPVLRHPACTACGTAPEDRPLPWSDEDIRVARMLLDDERQKEA